MSAAGEAFLRQSSALSAWASGLAAREWAAPSALPNWTVRDLVAHLVIVHESLVRTLAVGSDEPATPLGAYVSTYSAHSEELDFTVPPAAYGESWDVVLDTDGTVDVGEVLQPGETVSVTGRSVIVLTRPPLR